MKVVKKRLVYVGLAICGVIGFTPAAVFAAPNSLSATGPTTVSSDAQSVTVTIESDLGSTPIPVVDAYVTFDPTKLEYLGVNYAGSPFTADTIDTAMGSNYIKISRYATAQPYPSGIALLGKISFRPKVSSGTTQISFDRPQSGLYNEQGDDVLASTVSLGITFTAPTAPPPSTTPSTAAPSTQPSTSGGGGTTAPRPTTGTNSAPPVASPGNPAATPATETTTETVTTEQNPAAQPQGTVAYKQTAYSGGTNTAVAFFAKTPVRVGLITIIALSVLVVGYIVTTGIRQRKYIQMTTSQTSNMLPPNPTANGIMVGYNPTVVNPQSPQQPNDIERQ